MSFQAEQRWYFRLIPWRDALVAPLTTLLDKVGVSPLVVTLIGQLSMVFFVRTVGTFPFTALLCTLVYLLADMVDGALARRQGTASDQGKLLDLAADSTAAILFMLGLLLSGAVSLLGGVLWISGQIVSRLIRVWRHKNQIPTTWRFRAVAGLFPAFLVLITYVAWLLDQFAGSAVLPFVTLSVGIILLLDGLTKSLLTK